MNLKDRVMGSKVTSQNIKRTSSSFKYKRLIELKIKFVPNQIFALLERAYIVYPINGMTINKYKQQKLNDTFTESYIPIL